MYEARDQEDILKELQDKSTTAASKFEGTLEYEMLASNSIEFAKVEVEIEQAYKAAFADTAADVGDDYLSMKTGEQGVVRKQAVAAVGVVTAIGTGTVTKGSIFATPAGTQFAAKETTKIVKSGDVDVEALVAGTGGNVAAGTITLIPASIPGIISVTNQAETHGGYDREGNADLLTRYHIKVRMPATSGNPWHYIEWATSVEGVGSAKCTRAWAGPNTVKVIIIDSNMQEADQALITKTYDYIESVRPLGAVVTVVSAKTKGINVTFTKVGTFDAEAFAAAVKTYLMTIERASMLSGEAAYVSIANIGRLIIDAGGATDYESLKLNDVAGNVVLSDEELPALGVVKVDG